MAYATVLLTNGVEIKKVPLGHSWTTWMFGGIPGLFRQDWTWGIVLTIVDILLFPWPGIIASFFYNKVYAKSLFAKGYYIHTLPPEVSEEKLKTYLGFLTLPEKPKPAAA